MHSLTISRLWNRLSGRHGQALVITVFFILALFAFAALSIDGGRLYIERKKLQNATDAAALAGASTLPLKSPSDTDYDSMSRAFAITNKVLSSEVVSVEVGHYDRTAKTFTAGGAPNDSVRVAAQRNVTLT